MASKSWVSSFCLTAFLAVSVSPVAWSARPPSADEQAAYQAAVQKVIDSVNTYRAQQSPALPALTPLVELCKASRVDCETYLNSPGSSPDFQASETSAGYTGSAIGNLPFFIDGKVSFDPAGFIATALNDSTNGATAMQILKDPNATEIGVGIAMSANNDFPVLFWELNTGKKKTANSVSGTTGIETDSGRGLPDLSPSQIDLILNGYLSGDSTAGFVLAFFAPDVIDAYQASKATFAKKAAKVKGKVGKALVLNIPFGIANVVQKFQVKGKLPPGVKFSKLQGSFGGFSGKPTQPGTYVAQLTGTFSGEIDNTIVLPPIQIKFVVK